MPKTSDALVQVQQVQEQRPLRCHRCGGKTHLSNACRFRNVDCRACGKRGPIARVCNSKTSKQFRGKPTSRGHGESTPNVHSLGEVSPPSALDVDSSPHQERSGTLPVFSLQSKSQPLVTTVRMNNKEIPMEVDTGAALSLISEGTYSSNFSGRRLQPTEVQLRTYSGERISVLGSLEVEVEYESQVATLPLLVVKGNGPCLLGRNWMAVIRLNWNRICKVNTSPSLEKVLRKHPDVFREELGLLRGATPKINIQSGPTPKFFKARTVSYFLREKVDKELQRLQEQEIISPVTFSDWAAPIVPVLKTDENVRICGDYKVTVNPVAHSDAYPLPRV